MLPGEFKKDGQVDVGIVASKPRIKWRQTWWLEGRMAVCECGWRQGLALQRRWCPKCGIATLVSEENRYV